MESSQAEVDNGSSSCPFASRLSVSRAWSLERSKFRWIRKLVDDDDDDDDGEEEEEEEEEGVLGSTNVDMAGSLSQRRDQVTKILEFA